MIYCICVKEFSYNVDIFLTINYLLNEKYLSQFYHNANNIIAFPYVFKHTYYIIHASKDTM